MARICVDMDEVMADTLAEHIRRYNLDHHASLTKADLHGKWLWQAVPFEHHERLQLYLDTPDFFSSLPVLPGAQRVLRELSEHHEVFVASAAMEVPRSFAAKFEWLEEHFPFIPRSHMVFCGTKSILSADFLIDDNPRQLRAFGGHGLLFSSPHNLLANGWTRVEDWDAVARFFASLPQTESAKSH